MKKGEELSLIKLWTYIVLFLFYLFLSKYFVFTSISQYNIKRTLKSATQAGGGGHWGQCLENISETF